MPVSPSRLAAYRVLRAVETNRADLPRALARERLAVRDARDQALATEIATGTLRWRAALDHLIGTVAGRSVNRLDPEVLDVLRLSAYQLLHLDRVPAAAVVDDAVRLTGQIRKRSAQGFVNAVLRSLGRRRHHLPLPDRPAVPPDGSGVAPEHREAWLDYLSITLSHPRWLAGRWLDRYGPGAACAWEEFNNGSAPLTLRTNLLKTTPAALADALERSGVATEAARYAPAGLIVRRGSPYGTTLAAEGLFAVQDEASQLVALMAGVLPGDAVLDACASPGGKTTAMAAAMNDRGLIVAADKRASRIDLLHQTVLASGARSVRIVRADLQQRLPFRRGFDCVLVDAPCSGLGTIRRDPEIRWRRTEADLARFASAQAAMLDHAAEAVAPGGRLVYATCSSEPEENDEVVESFLGGHPEFAAVDPRRSDRPPPPGLAAVLDATGRLRTAPHLHGLEAFFAVLLIRRP